MFSCNGIYFAYDYSKHNLLSLNHNLYHELTELCTTNFQQCNTNVTLDTSSPLIKALIENGLFFSSTEPLSDFPAPIYETAYFSFPSAHTCNLRCKYCFANHGKNYIGAYKHMTTDMVDSILNFVYYIYFPHHKYYRLDFVSGGEPLIHFDIIKYAIKKVREIDKESGKRTQIFLCTNGTINNDEIWKFLDQNNVHLGISIDGEQFSHDAVRQYEDGTGSYQSVKATIQNILSKGDFSPRMRAIWGLSVLSAANTDVKKVLQHNRSLGLSHMQMKLARLPQDHSLFIDSTVQNKLIQSYAALVDYFVDQSNQHNYKDLMSILNDTDYFGKIMCRIIHGGQIYKRCLAGTQKISFDVEGNIYPCDSFLGNNNFLLGNISSGITNQALVNEFEKGSIFERSLCRTCWARFLCGGDCFHDSFLVNNSIHEPNAFYCKFAKKLIELGLYLYYTIRKNQDLPKLKNFILLRKKIFD